MRPKKINRRVTPSGAVMRQAGHKSGRKGVKMKRWKPSKSAAQDFAAKMKEIDAFCDTHDISSSLSDDSYYFSINGQNYRVSNHSVEASNAAAFDDTTGEQRREVYHEGGRRDDTIYIHASKTRIMDIYNDLTAGYKLDGRGRRKEA